MGVRASVSAASCFLNPLQLILSHKHCYPELRSLTNDMFCHSYMLLVGYQYIVSVILAAIWLSVCCISLTCCCFAVSMLCQTYLLLVGCQYIVSVIHVAGWLSVYCVTHTCFWLAVSILCQAYLMLVGCQCIVSIILDAGWL